MHSIDITTLNKTPSPNRIFIIGGGIVGSSLAYFLSKNSSTNANEIILIDKCLDKLLGSTGHAPGFVGQLNESPVLTTLAKDTVSEYMKVPNGFDVVGGLELSATDDGVENLKKREQVARSSGLPAEILTPERAEFLAPDFIDAQSVKAGLLFGSDGTANAKVLTEFYIREAQAKGVKFVEGEVTGFKVADDADRNIESIHIRQGNVSEEIPLNGSRVILATGIWTSPLAKDIVPFPIPIVPVSHPYTFTSSRPRRSGRPYPFVRWLDHHVYARDHGECDGLGSYDHPPLRMSPEKTAIGDWPEDFKEVLIRATLNLKNGQQFLVQSQSGGEDEPADSKQPFNGIFAVTPDNLPLAGRIGVSNLWLCAAIWVTTAAGTAKLISRQILGSGQESFPGDEELLKALDPARFGDAEEAILEKQALDKYNDIYNRGSEN